jgi:glycosyltransferase involved in cell wall biosynthesis
MERRLAVCINAFNAEKTIEKVIVSLIEQTFKEFYVFIIDNGSTDSTLKICDEYVRALTFAGTEWPDLYVFKAETHKEGLIPFLERIVGVLSTKVKNKDEVTNLYFINQGRPLELDEVEQECNEMNPL